MQEEVLYDSVGVSDFLRIFVNLAGRLGVETTESELRRHYTLASSHVPLATLLGMIADLGLEVGRVQLSWDEIGQLKGALPAMMTLKDGSFLLAEGVLDDTPQGRILIAQDPRASDEENTIAFDQQRFERLCSGDFILLKRKYKITDTERPFGLMWLVSQILVERRLIRDIAIASVVTTIFTFMPIVLMMIVMDRVLVNHSYSTLTVVAVAVALLIAFEMAIGFTRRLFMEVMATRIDGRLSIFLFERLVALPVEYFERNPTGLIQSKLSKIWQIRGFLTGKLLQTFLDLIVVLVIVPILLLFNWQLTLVVLSLVLVISGIVYLFARPIALRYKAVVAAEQRKNIHLIETIYGIRTIKSLAIEGRRRSEWDLRVAESIEARFRVGQLANVPQTLSVPFDKLIYSGSFLLGAYLTLQDPSTFMPGALMAFMMLSSRAAQPLVQLAQMTQELGEIREAVHEVASVVNSPPEVTRMGSGLRQPISGNITFSDVSFRYAPGTPLALSSASFEIPAGSIFGIMGRSGSGKTTITRLLQGLNSHYEGIVKVDGMDLREIDLQHLRTRIGVVAQENFLFSGSIRENIGIAKPGATFSEIVRVAQLAGAEEFIERLPRGYDTMLAEGAANLSGGQRQRLAIARALILDPPILILDEATSALDAESEAIINANLLRIAQGRTIICVSHRLAMLVNADKILVMEKGEVNDIGSHQELVHRNEIYKHMWFTQNRPPEGAVGARISIARA